MDAGAPTGANFNAATRTFTWTPAEDQGPGTNTVTLRVTDNGSPALNDFETITIVVTETNSPPVLGAIGDKTVDEGALLTFTATATDADNPANTPTYSLDPGAPTGTSINPATGLFTWTPTETQGPATNTITVRVTDNGSPAMSDAGTLTIVVREVNAPPVLTPVTNQTVTAGIQVTITNAAADPDIPTNVLSFTLDSGAPGGASINPTSGVFTWTPSAAQAPGTNLITVRVTDNGAPALSDARSFTVVVNSVAELRLTGIAMSSGALVTLNWSSQTGKTYRVESKDDLNQTTWSSQGDYNATNSTTSATISVSGTSQRYYRIQQVN
jgi:hypothetical protein